MIFCCTNVSGKDEKMTLVENYEAYIKYASPVTLHAVGS
jgi:hypothetical protein